MRECEMRIMDKNHAQQLALAKVAQEKEIALAKIAQEEREQIRAHERHRAQLSSDERIALATLQSATEKHLSSNAANALLIHQGGQRYDTMAMTQSTQAFSLASQSINGNGNGGSG